MKRYFLPTFLLSAFISGCVSNHTQNRAVQFPIYTLEDINTSKIQFSAFPLEKIKTSNITWNEPFGYSKKNTNDLYLPMTQGLFLTPQSKNFTGIIHSWLVEHTNAEAMVIYTLEPVRTNEPDSIMKSVWITDGTENLNVFLVRNGSCPAFTMLLNQGDKTSLTQEQYKTTAKEIIEAEVSAKKKSLVSGMN